MNAIVQSDERDSQQWVASPRPMTLEILAETDPFPKQPVMDLYDQPGLRVWLRPTPTGANLILYVHHAACDALGMLTFSMEWLAISSGTAAGLPPFDAELLRQRENFSGVKPAFTFRQRMRNISRIIFGKPSNPLAIPRESPGGDQHRPESYFHSVGFSREESDLLRSKAREHHSSLNDLLTASLFLTIQDWDDEFRSQSSNRPWRVLIPVNRRAKNASIQSSCNCVGYKILSQPQRGTSSFTSLIAKIRREMEPVRRAPQGVYSFLKMLKLFSRLGLLQYNLRRHDCIATAILSNLGDLNRYFSPRLDDRGGKLHAGSITIEAIRCSPPRRRNTHVSIVVLSYVGQLQLVSSRLGRGLDDAQTLKFLERFRETILETLKVNGKP